MVKEKEKVPPLYMPDSRVRNAPQVSACAVLEVMGESLTLIWADCEVKIEKVRRVWPGCFHRAREVELGQVCVARAVRTLVPGARGDDVG